MQKLTSNINHDVKTLIKNHLLTIKKSFLQTNIQINCGKILRLIKVEF